MNKCIDCGVEVAGELTRCSVCQIEHQKLCVSLDARPKQIVEKVPVKWVKYQQVRNGITITTYMTREEALLVGKKIEE